MARLIDIFARVKKEDLGVWLWRSMAVVVLAFLFFVAGGGVSQGARWKVTRVDISGAQAVNDDAIRSFVEEKLAGNYYFVYARGNSHLFPAREIKQGLLVAFPRLASARAMRVDEHTIAVTVTERIPFALWCGDEFAPTPHELAACSFIDQTGFIFDHAPAFSDGVYAEVYAHLPEGQVRRLRAEQFMIVDAFARTLKDDLGEPLRIVINPNGEYDVVIYKSAAYPVLAGVELRFKEGEAPEVLTKKLLLALPVQFPAGVNQKKKLLYIDMRFGNKIFFGFEN